MKLLKVPSILIFLIYCSCGKKDDNTGSTPVSKNPSVNSVSINTVAFNAEAYNINTRPVITIRFSQPLMQNTITSAITFKGPGNTVIPFSTVLQNTDSVLVIQPTSALNFLSKYNVIVSTALKSASGGNLQAPIDRSFITIIDSSRKFPIISDDALLDSVQKRTFKYFWDLAHPVSGMARERNTDANIYTSGGTGFGIMAIVTAVHRNFITRAEGLLRLQAMVSFLKNTAEVFHGAYPHWLNGQTGKVIPFSQKDNGADLVETSYLIQGLLTARQYFNGADAIEADLRNDINAIVNRVEWDWFRKGNENVLYWHWSPNYGWDMNMQIKGWNECQRPLQLILYLK
jgi:hypothetical protein